MRRLLRWYGANPLHLLALLACFALAGYASVPLVQYRPLAVAIWFTGAVVGHDLLLVPLYSLADRSATAALRHRAPPLPAIPWINYLRVPAALSALLLLIWLPLILRLHTNYHASTTLSPNPYLWHWLAVTGALFLLSAAAFALRLRGRPRAAAPPGGGARRRPLSQAMAQGKHLVPAVPLLPALQAVHRNRRALPGKTSMNQQRPARSAPHPAQLRAAARKPSPARDRTSQPSKPKPPPPPRITRTRMLPGTPQRTGKHTSPRTIHSYLHRAAWRFGANSR